MFTEVGTEQVWDTVVCTMEPCTPDSEMIIVIKWSLLEDNCSRHLHCVAIGAIHCSDAT